MKQLAVRSHHPANCPLPTAYLTVTLIILLFLLPGKGSVRKEKSKSKCPFSEGAVKSKSITAPSAWL